MVELIGEHVVVYDIIPERRIPGRRGLPTGKASFAYPGGKGLFAESICDVISDRK